MEQPTQPDTDIKGYEHLDKREQKWVGVMQRRATHLRNRIDKSPHDLSFDKQEMGAIQGLLAWIARH
jgi:hypothetical protein